MPKILIYLFLHVTCCVLLVSHPASAAEEKEAALARDERGVVIDKDVRLDIPSDRKVIQVASNVVRPENRDDYVDKRIDNVEARLELISGRLRLLEKRMEELEKLK